MTGNDSEPREPALRRRLGLGLLTLYGLGTTIGAGIYVLIGLVAGEAGRYAPLAFLIAALLAGVTALAYAELSSRFPVSAGEARFVREGLGSPSLSLLVGLLAITVGIVSAATITVGAAGYVRHALDIPAWIVIAAVGVGFTLLAIKGIAESVGLAALVTFVEIGGLVVVIVAAAVALAGGSTPEPVVAEARPVSFSLAGLFAGVILAFFAFIGFEDMENVAEEVKDPVRTMPRAIGLTLAVTVLLYMALSVLSVALVAPAELGASEAPLALVYARSGAPFVLTFVLVGVLATLNGVLIQMIMASRVLYGLSRQGQLPALMGVVWARTGTPVPATLLVGTLVLGLSLAVEIELLARFTSVITLAIFTFVNLALWRLRRRGPGPVGTFRAPSWAPVVGTLASAFVLVVESIRLGLGI